MRTIAVVTVGRADYGVLLPVLRRIQAAPDLRLCLIAGGMHLAEDFGHTVTAIEADGFEIADRVDMQLASDTPVGIATAIGSGTIGFARAYARMKADLLVLMGDRFETLAAAAAALPFGIPLAHLHGGELSAGAFDEQIRHAITKMSHLHFVATPTSAERVIQMGEEPWRVTVSGAPSLDNLRALSLLSVPELERELGIGLTPTPLLVTYHPETLAYQNTGRQVNELFAALAELERPIIITYPNADTSSRQIIDALEAFAREHDNVRVVKNLGTTIYFSVMSCSAAMVGNSSSGIIEAASVRLPVVNIGERQAGRERAANVIDVGASRSEIARGIHRALDPDFRKTIRDLQNPYGDGCAAERIVRVLGDVPIDRRLRRKIFHSMASACTSA